MLRFSEAAGIKIMCVLNFNTVVVIDTKQKYYDIFTNKQTAQPGFLIFYILLKSASIKNVSKNLITHSTYLTAQATLFIIY